MDMEYMRYMPIRMHNLFANVMFGVGVACVPDVRARVFVFWHQTALQARNDAPQFDASIAEDTPHLEPNSETRRI